MDRLLAKLHQDESVQGVHFVSAWAGDQMNVIHRIERAYWFTGTEFRTSGNANVRRLLDSIKQKSLVAKRLFVLIAAHAYMDVAHRGHSDQLAERSKILNRKWKQYFFIPDKSRGLAI